MTENANGKTILVTGGNRGIGKAISLALAKEGYSIIFTYNTGKSEADSVLEEISKMGVKAEGFRVDLSSPEELGDFTAKIIAQNPKLFALINNAGIYKGHRLNNISNDEWEAVVGLNLSAPFYLARNLHGIIEDGGSIVNISSVYGIRADPWAHDYQASKAALIHLTRGLAKELAPRIRVNCVAPGYVMTDINRMGWEDQSFNEKIRKMTPADRWGEPDDISNAVEFLIRLESGFITGITLVVDGGISL